ncbi:unnamed protein product [Gongylonema pulchrum]|uniref:Uncharacterized protein n=1 Tax=Gongylonema pulchrum TaxID=637853 RepID=A0A183EVT7_9BILA|nr:unnamed protein product [Gongylonema pulchrum]
MIPTTTRLLPLLIYASTSSALISLPGQIPYWVGGAAVNPLLDGDLGLGGLAGLLGLGGLGGGLGGLGLGGLGGLGLGGLGLGGLGLGGLGLGGLGLGGLGLGGLGGLGGVQVIRIPLDGGNGNGAPSCIPCMICMPSMQNGPTTRMSILNFMCI